MYLNRFIPVCEGFGWTGAPGFHTRIVVLANGRERRNADWAQERNRYTVPFLNISAAQYASIRQMFQVARGMAHAFLFLDQLDASAEDEVFAIADGSPGYQLTKNSTLDGVTYRRTIHALYTPGSDGSAIPATPEVTADFVPIAVTVDHERGIVYPNTPPTPGAVLRWSGPFAVWVRFDQDELPWSIDNRRGHDYAHNGQIVLMELPPPPEVET